MNLHSTRWHPLKRPILHLIIARSGVQVSPLLSGFRIWDVDTYKSVGSGPKRKLFGREAIAHAVLPRAEGCDSKRSRSWNAAGTDDVEYLKRFNSVPYRGYEDAIRPRRTLHDGLRRLSVRNCP